MTDETKKDALGLSFRVPGRDDPLEVSPKDEANRQEWLGQALERGWELIRLPDPIFAAIEAHRAAVAAVDVSGVLADDDVAHEITDRTSEELDAAAIPLVDVRPTTLAGLVALLSHVAECSCRGGDWKLPEALVEQGGTFVIAQFDEGESFAYFVLRTSIETIRQLVPRA